MLCLQVVRSYNNAPIEVWHASLDAILQRKSTLEALLLEENICKAHYLEHHMAAMET